MPRCRPPRVRRRWSCRFKRSSSAKPLDEDAEGDEEKIDVVFVVDGDSTKQVPIETGLSDTTHVEILSGLEEGGPCRHRPLSRAPRHGARHARGREVGGRRGGRRVVMSSAVKSAVIELNGIHKIYEMGTEQIRALDGVDLDIGRGEYVAIMGASGSGKSTLMNLIGCLGHSDLGLLSSQRGPPSRSSTTGSSLTSETARSGFIFQTFNLLSRNARPEETSSCR